MGAPIVPDARSQRLCALGLLYSDNENVSFAAITADGLRALADAVDAGRIALFTMPERKG